MTRNLAASVRARLLNMAKAEGSDFNQILVRYALERFLYRLSQSAYADHFLLKGALLFTLWYELPHRATRDCDLLGFGPSDQETIVGTFRAIAAVPVDDGIVFDPESVRVGEIRKDAGYAGVRVVITGELAQARCKTQIDIGFGDAVIPGPVKATYPVLIEDFPAPRLRTYPAYTVVAEKLHAIVLLGMTNSRLKDYLDLFVLLDREHLNEKTLARAIAATFDRRGTPLSDGLPLGLSDEFASDVSRQALWQAFLRKNDIEWRQLRDIVTAIRTRLQPSLIQAARLSSARRR
jgi:predicted nucleotidyltransferase component of viral defense system